MGDHRQQTRVDPTGAGHDDPSEGGELGPQAGQLAVDTFGKGGHDPIVPPSTSEAGPEP
jgi:hypothetical protein